jgi:hypothetical protein
MTGTMPPVMAYFRDRPLGLSFFFGYYLLHQQVKEEKLIVSARGGGRSKQKNQNIKNNISLNSPACFQSFLIC